MNNAVRILCCWLLACVCTVACMPKSGFVVVATTDVHGRIFSGYARVASYVKTLRQSGKPVLLLDCGDYLQGSTSVYYSNLLDAERYPHVMSAVFNTMDYTAITVGNHDIEAGKQVFDRVYSQVNCPVLCANIRYVSTKEPYFTPYIVKKVGGYKVAILGLTTPYVSTWVSKRLRPGIEFEPIAESARYWVERIQEDASPDFLIAIIHSGYQGGASGYMGEENEVEYVARSVPGIDLICYGHDHIPLTRKITSENGEEVEIMNPGAYATNVAVAEVNHKGLKTTELTVAIEPVSELEADSILTKRLASFTERVFTYENTPIAELLNPIRSDDVYKGPCGWVDEIHRAQLELAGLGSDMLADVSFAAALSSGDVLPAGPLLLKDFFTWLPFENSLCLVKMTGQEIKDYLEYSYGREDEQVFNFDTAAGIMYRVDTTATYGNRVQILSMADGERFSLARTYYVAMNSYRSMGGGGHLLEGLGWTAQQTEQRRVWEEKIDLRRLFMDWEASRTPFEALPLNQWYYQ